MNRAFLPAYKVVGWALRLVIATLSAAVGWNTGVLIAVLSVDSAISGPPPWASGFAWSAALVCAVVGWRLFDWTTSPVQPGAKRVPLLAWASAGVIGAGLLWPFTTLEWFVSCRDECHGFIFVAPLAGLVCLAGAAGLAHVAQGASVPPSPIWRYLREGLPRSSAARFLLTAIPIATAMLALAVSDVPLFVGLVWSGAAVAMAVSGCGVFRSHNQSGEGAVLTVDLRPIVLVLAGVLVMQGVLVVSWFDQLYPRLQ